MKRLKLKEKPKRLNLSSCMEPPSPNRISSKEPDIEVILEQYHNHTKEDKSLPYHEWIKFKDHLPLDENKPILLYDKSRDNMFDGFSFVALQHALHSKYMNYDNIPSHWMRIKKPEN